MWQLLENTNLVSMPEFKFLENRQSYFRFFKRHFAKKFKKYLFFEDL